MQRAGSLKTETRRWNPYLVLVVLDVELQVSPQVDLVCVWQDHTLLQVSDEPAHRDVI